MLEYQYTITDPSGLHARPATMIASCCMEHKSFVQITSGNHVIDGRDVLALMSLYVKTGQKILFSIQGEDEEKTLSDLKKVLKNL